MRQILKYSLVLPVFLTPLFLTACVSQSKYDDVVAQNQQLQQQVSSLSAQMNAAQTQVGRLQSAIKYTVESDLLFPPGGWEMSDAGKEVIGKFTSKLAPTQQNKLVVNGYTDNSPVGRELKRKGITSNEILSQKRAENVMEYLISQGMQPSLVSAVGHGEADPIAPNNSATGRAKNRRVELTLGGPAS
jgi:chemotaxis protein MotB